MIKERLLSALSAAVAELAPGSAAPSAHLDVPPTPELGDFSTDVALQVARESRQAPAAVARALAERLVPAEGSQLAALLDRVDVAPSGVLNFRLRSDWRETALHEACELGASFGRQDEGGEKILVEFVSADPTGPLTVTHGRGAVLGDAICRLLEATGHQVSREYYVNDAGTQAETLGKSLDAALAGRKEALGEYLETLASAFRAERASLGAAGIGSPQALAQTAAKVVVAEHRAVLERLGVRFDQWRSEAELHTAGRTDEALDLLRSGGHTYTSDGAEWLRTTAFGEASDHALRRGNGQLTYLAGDLAYHLDKFRRGYARVVDVWGTEHAHYVERTQAGMMALGIDPGSLEIVIFQPVRVRVDGMLVEGMASSSNGLGNPSGNNVPLEEVLERVGPEAARWLYLSRPSGVSLELDLDKDRLSDPTNPSVRVRSALSRAQSASAANPLERASPQTASLSAASPPQLLLANLLVRFPDEVRAAAADREPAHLSRYALSVADAYLAVADDATGAEADSSPPVLLSRATAVVLTNSLSILGFAA